MWGVRKCVIVTHTAILAFHFNHIFYLRTSTFVHIIQYGFSLTILLAAAAKSLQSCLTLCDPTDGSPSDSPVPGILQARTLEWVAISFSLGSEYSMFFTGEFVMLMSKECSPSTSIETILCVVYQPIYSVLSSQ